MKDNRSLLATLPIDTLSNILEYVSWQDNLNLLRLKNKFFYNFYKAPLQNSLKDKILPLLKQSGWLVEKGAQKELVPLIFPLYVYANKHDLVKVISSNVKEDKKKFKHYYDKFTQLAKTNKEMNKDINFLFGKALCLFLTGKDPDLNLMRRVSTNKHPIAAFFLAKVYFHWGLTTLKTSEAKFGFTSTLYEAPTISYLAEAFENINIEIKIEKIANLIKENKLLINIMLSNPGNTILVLKKISLDDLSVLIERLKSIETINPLFKKDIFLLAKSITLLVETYSYADLSAYSDHDLGNKYKEVYKQFDVQEDIPTSPSTKHHCVIS